MRHDRVMGHINRLKPQSIIEVGIGTGALGYRLARTVETYVGTEPDAESRTIASSTIDRGRVVESVDSLNSELFDMLCAFEVIEHIEDDRSAVAEWLAHVRPGGHVMISVPAFRDRFGVFDEFAGHFRRYDPADLRSLLEGLNLQVLDISVNGAPIGFASEFVKNRLASRRLDQTETTHDRTMESGRVLKPSAGGRAIEFASLPFRKLQRLFPNSGTGLLALAQKPE